MKNQRECLIAMGLMLLSGFMPAQDRGRQTRPAPSRSAPLVAQELSREGAYFYLLRFLGVDDNCIIEYGVTFDANNYWNSKDEFERNKYRAKIKNVLAKGVSGADFTKKFTVVGRGVLGEYNFDNKSFPMASWSFDVNLYFNGEGGAQRYFRSRTGDSINLNDFNASVRMDADAASTFVKMRKQSNGSVDRTVYLRKTYSLLDKQLPKSSNNEFNFGSYAYSIEVFEDNQFTRRMDLLLPATEYADKIHGIERLDAQKIIYYKGRYRAYWGSDGAAITKFGELPSKEGAEFYRVIDYEGGKISEVKDYYVTGELEMEGHYGPYCAEPHCANGLFTWYYKNGHKRQDETFVNGSESGDCIHVWDEKGKCKRPPAIGKTCLCTDQMGRVQGDAAKPVAAAPAPGGDSLNTPPAVAGRPSPSRCSPQEVEVIQGFRFGFLPPSIVQSTGLVGAAL